MSMSPDEAVDAGSVRAIRPESLSETGESRAERTVVIYDLVSGKIGCAIGI